MDLFREALLDDLYTARRTIEEGIDINMLCDGKTSLQLAIQEKIFAYSTISD